MWWVNEFCSVLISEKIGVFYFFALKLIFVFLLCISLDWGGETAGDN